MAYTDKNYSTSFTFWQDNEEGIEEVAIVVSRVHDGLTIQQKDQSIYVTETAINDFIKLLITAIKEKP